MAFHSPAKFTILALATGLAGLANPVSATVVLEVAINTSSLARTTAQLAFDLIDSDGLVNNTVTITAFSTDGALGTAATVGGVTGTLPGTVMLADTDFFNEWLQSITLADAIHFTLNLTENAPSGPIPDAFSLFLLDSMTLQSFDLDTSDPTGANALFAVDLGVADGLQVYQSVPGGSAVTWTVTNTTIPEPGMWLLFGNGLLGWAGHRRRR